MTIGFAWLLYAMEVSLHPDVDLNTDLFYDTAKVFLKVEDKNVINSKELFQVFVCSFGRKHEY